MNKLLEEPLLQLDGAATQDAVATVKTAQLEDTPAYTVLQSHGLLTTTHRKESFDDIFNENDLSPNSSQSHTFMKRLKWGVSWTPGCGLIIYKLFNTEVTVPPGHICCLVDSDNNYLFAKPGVHNITDPFLSRDPNMYYPFPIANSETRHGNRTVVTIHQGNLGYAEDMGQPILLPPGMHSWTSESLTYIRQYSLDQHVITIGPYTILTVDEGYAAITQNNGRQVILNGGETHLLTHKKWRFEKFLTLKIQTDDLERIQAASADNVIMEVNSTVVWKIKDATIAATTAAETMASTGGEVINADITKLRKDVLKQAIASLAGFIGRVNYSDSFHVAAAAQRHMETAQVVSVSVAVEGEEVDPAAARSAENPMFDTDGMSEAVSHANQITRKFGVEILSINIISANPVDKNLTSSLATGAVASAEALQAETAARGNAKAMKIQSEAEAKKREIDANSKAQATLIRAKADAEAETVRATAAKSAEILRAEGSKIAAELIESSQVAVKLETIKSSSLAIQKSDKFFFGQEPSYMKNIFVRAPDKSMQDGCEDDLADYHLAAIPVASNGSPPQLD